MIFELQFEHIAPNLYFSEMLYELLLKMLGYMPEIHRCAATPSDVTNDCLHVRQTKEVAATSYLFINVQ